MIISIHALTRSATDMVVADEFSSFISIHALTRSATLYCLQTLRR